MTKPNDSPSPFSGKYPTLDEMNAYLERDEIGLSEYATVEVTPEPPMGDGTPGPLAAKLTECKSEPLLRYGPKVFRIAVVDLLKKSGVVVPDHPESK